MLPLAFVESFDILARLAVRRLKLIHHLGLQLLLLDKFHVQIIDCHILLVQLGFLCEERLLESLVVFVGAVFLHCQAVLLLLHAFVLNHGLLKKSSESQTLLNVRLHFVVRLLMLTQLNILFELLNKSVLLDCLGLQVSVLFLELLDEETFQVVGLLGNGLAGSSRDVASLLLQLSCTVFNILLFLLQVDCESLQASSQTRVLIFGYVKLNLQVSVGVLNFFPFLWSSEHGLVNLGDRAALTWRCRLLRCEVLKVVPLAISCRHSSSLLTGLLQISTAEQDVSGPVVVDDLLDHLTTASPL